MFVSALTFIVVVIDTFDSNNNNNNNYYYYIFELIDQYDCTCISVPFLFSSLYLKTSEWLGNIIHTFSGNYSS